MTKLKSHPEKSLFSHLKNTAELSKKIVESKKLENNDIYSKIAYLNGIAHDFAKSTTFFQKWLSQEERTENAIHGHFSSIFGYFLVKIFLTHNGLKNSFDSLPAITFVVINKHHGNLINIMGGHSNLVDKIKDKKSKQIIKKQITDIRNNNFDEIKSIYKALLNGFDFEISL
ncbi:MAG: CRISPR-associated endonuclease Cas3'', partial [Candidatus Aenigmatarchaeota archaeon]